MSGAGAVDRPRVWGGRLLLLLLTVACVLGLAVGTVDVTHADTPADGPTEGSTDAPGAPDPALDAACATSLRRHAQVVACTLRGAAPDGAVAIAVAASDAAGEDFIGGSRVADDGAARVEAHVPCEVAGPAEVEVTAPAADGGRFRHVEPVELDGRCRALWELTSGQWATLVATVLVLVAVLVVVVGLRRRARHRRRRSVRTHPPQRPRRRARWGAGRRRSPRRRRRRQSR